MGGGAWAVNSLRSSGAQPEQVLPSNAIAYLRVDLDPSAGQKLEVLEFARKFPDAKSRLGDGEDLRKALFDAMKSEDDDLKDVDYATDIEPWLGDRLGVAAVPGTDGKEASAVAAVEVTDEAKAREGVDKLQPEGDKTGYAFADDYMIIADTQGEADRFAKSALESPLADNEQFQDDLDALGETGVMSFWADAAKLASIGGGAAPRAAGRHAEGVRADRRRSEFREWCGSAAGRRARCGDPEAHQVRDQAGPASRHDSGGISVAGAGPAFEQAWPNLRRLIEQAGQAAEVDSFLRSADQQFGIKLPADLVTLLGTDLTLAVDERGLAEAMSGAAPGSSGMPALPQAGFRSTTDVAKAK